MSDKTKRLGSLAAVMLAILAPILGWIYRWDIYDAWRLRNYQPPGEVAQLASDTTMRDKTRRLFYVHHPAIEDRQNFNAHCSNTEKTIVLGCYIAFRGIYLFNVTDPRLAGVEQVTAAHEALHAAYDRLSSSEKKHINSLLDQAYAGVTDKRIRDTIDDYRKNGADITNELHSILGTEVRKLPAELEQYYARYFSNRSAIVSFSEKYEHAFTDLKAQADAFLQQMNQIQARLKDLQAVIDQQEATLRQKRAELDAERSQADTPTEVQAFNAKVDAYNAQVRTYQSTVATYNRLVASFNELLNKYNAIALEESELLKALDSRSATIDQQ